MSSSGASTPRGAMTPPPPGQGDGPSPLTVGTRFVKQYYKVLSTTPNQIHRFYQPTSFLSHGKGSEPTHAQLFERMQVEQMDQQAQDLDPTNQTQLKQRFVLEGYEDCPIRFEFEHGAIDAQVSVNGGVLLVVTGHIVYLPLTLESKQERRKAFVHTFFLGSISAGTKRSYYVHNDILRFLHDDQDHSDRMALLVASTNTNTMAATTTSTSISTSTEGLATSEKVKVVPDVPPIANGGTGTGTVEVKVAPVVEEKKMEPVLEVEDAAASTSASASATTPVKEIVEAPGGGVEETKEDASAEVPPNKSTATGTLEGTEKLLSKPKPPPGSWASLVASSGPSAASTPTPGTPARTASKPKSKSIPALAPAAMNTNTNTTAAAPATPKRSVPAVPHVTTPTAETKPESSRANRSNKRDPDCTLVIKNIDAATTEPDVMTLFEPFSIQTESKIVGITVSANRSIAFVDYDAAAPVLKAVEQHTKEPMQIRGRVLEIYQKTLEQRARRGGGGGGSGGGGGGGGRGAYRGGQGQAGGEGGYRGGGRQQFRRGTGGRGDGSGGRGGEGTGGRGGESSGGRGGESSGGRGDRGAGRGGRAGR